MKINNLKFKISYLFICLLSYLFITQTTNATSLSLSIDPPIIIINAIPPTNVTSSLNIQNKSDAPTTLQIQIKPFKAKGEDGELEYSQETSPILKNLQILDDGVPVENITLDPQQQKKLSLNIKISPDTNISDYYFSVVFVSNNAPSVKSNFSINQIGIATNILLSVGALETPKTSLEELSSKIFFEKGPVPFMVRIKNTGTHFIRPTSVITIKNMFGQSVGKLNLTSANILSDSIRAIPVLWKENFLLGLYTATLNISMSDEGPMFIRTIHFFAFPLEGLIIIVITVMGLIVINNRLKKYMNKNRTSV